MIISTDETFASSLERPEHLIERLSEWLPTRRWYPMKDIERPKIHINDLFDFYYDSRMRCFSVLLQLTTEGRVENFHLPLVLTSMDEFLPENKNNIIVVKCKDIQGYLYEAEFLDMFCHTILELMDLDGILETRKHNYVYFKKFGKIETPLRDMEALEVLREDTSNFLVKIAFEGRGLRKYLLKSYRRVEVDNPELEMLTVLAEGGYRHVPLLFGYYIYTDFDSRNDIVLEIAQEFVENSHTGLRSFLENLNCIMQETLTGRKETNGVHASMLEKVCVVADGIAEMHAILARGKDETFREEPITSDDIDRWVQRIIGNMDYCKQNISTLIGQQSLIDRFHTVSEFIEDFLEKSRTVLEVARDIEIAEGLSKIRTHQDLHLGQLIFTTRGQFFVLDFEGEPLRKGKERKEKLPPLRDVATMIRSFAYVKCFAIANRLGKLGLKYPVDASSLLFYSHPLFLEKYPHISKSDIETIVNAANVWERSMVDAFVERYLKRSRSLDMENLSRHSIENLLRFWTVEKAIYELKYELTHRCENITIPMEGLLRYTRYHTG